MLSAMTDNAAAPVAGTYVSKWTDRYRGVRPPAHLPLLHPR